MVLRLLAVAVVVLATAVAFADPPIRAWEDRMIERIDVRGNRAVSAADVRAAVASRPGTKFHADIVEADVRALWQLGKFADVEIDGTVRPNGSLVLTFVVAERATIGKVVITGNHAFGEADLRDAIRLGADLDLAAIQASRERVRAMYASEGFLVATVAYTLVPAGKDRVDVRFEIAEKDRTVVHELRFVGNHQIGSPQLRAALQTRHGETYQQEVFERDLLLVSAYYWDRGYANVRVGEPTRTLSDDGRTMDITIPIEEGPAFTISAVHATGELLDSAQDTLDMLKVRAGTLFSRTTIATDREALSTRYEDDGYSDAMVLPLTKIDLPHRTIDLTFEVKRGVIATFDHIAILGNTTISESTIRRELAFGEGDQFNSTALDVSRKRLEALGVFDAVVVSTRHPAGAPEHVDVTFEVTEHADRSSP